MTNDQLLRNAIRAQKSALVEAAAAKAAEEQKRQDTEAFVRQKWPTLEQLLRGAIDDANKQFIAEGLSERFTYEPLPQPKGNVARSVLRMLHSTGVAKVEAILTVTTSGTIVSALRHSVRSATNYIKVAECTEHRWAQLLLELYKITLPRN